MTHAADCDCEPCQTFRDLEPAAVARYERLVRAGRPPVDAAMLVARAALSLGFMTLLRAVADERGELSAQTLVDTMSRARSLHDAVERENMVIWMKIRAEAVLEGRS